MIIKVTTSKKTWLLALAFLLLYKMKHFPQEINTSEFIQLLNSNFIIKELRNLNNSLLLFSRPDHSQYICHYPVTNLESFNSTLIRKGVRFDYLSGLQSVIANPYNQIFYLAGLLGVLSSQVVSTEVMKLKKYWSKKKFSAMTVDQIFEDFISTSEVKNHIKIIIDQLKNPEKYKEKKIKLIKGCLVYGKPGTGKTLLARCLSRIEGVTFINTCASEFVEIYVGTGPKRVREIFQLARENTPAIIFIDELESIGVHRSTDARTYITHSETYSTLNQLLAEMDGVINNDNIVVIAATNREDLLDAALVRPGRFDFKIKMAAPDKELRMNIFKLYLNKFNYDKNEITDEFIENLAENCNNVTGANIEGIVNDAATASFSINSSDKGITKEHLNEAFKRNMDEFYKFKRYELKNSEF